MRGRVQLKAKRGKTRSAFFMRFFLVCTFLTLLIVYWAEATTNSDDLSGLAFLRSYWDLGSKIGWPDPLVVDPCDNLASFPEIDPCDDSLATNKRITNLDIKNQILDPIPAEISDLTALRFLLLVNNGIGGILPPELGDLTDLEIINLSENVISGNLVDFGPNVRSIHLNDNDLSGFIPISYLSLPLNFLALANNDFTGTIPPFTTIESLNLANNDMNGVIPESLFTSTLFSLLLQQNNFNGALPSAVSSSTALQQIDLQGNNFAGEIPPFSAFFVFVNLQDNLFSGTLPPALHQNTNVVLNVNGNSLSGDLTVSPWASNQGYFIDFQNNQWLCPLPNYCSATGNGFCEPCVVPGPSSSNTPGPSSSNTPGPSSSNTPGPSSSNTPGPSSSNTPGPSSSNTPGPSSSNTPGPSSSNTPGPSSSNTPGPSSSNTPGPSSSNTPGPSSSNTPGPSSSNTPGPSSSNTPGPSSSNTPGPSSSNTPGPSSSNTPGPSSSNTPGPSSSNTPGPSSSNTPGPSSSSTPGPSSSNTPGPSSSNTPGPSSSNTPGPSSSNTPGPSSSNTPGPSSSNTPGPSSSNTPGPSSSNTPVPSSSNTPGPSSSNISTSHSFTPGPSSSATLAISSRSLMSSSATLSLSCTVTLSLFASPSNTASLSPSCTRSRAVSQGFAETVSVQSCDGVVDVCRVCNGKNECLRVTSTVYDFEKNCIAFQFSEDTNKAKMEPTNFDCSLLLTTETIDVLGDASYCWWGSSCLMYSCLGTGASVVPGDELFFIPDSVFSQSGDKVVVDEPHIVETTYLPRPLSIIRLPATVGIGSQLQLDGSYSKSMVGRPMLFSWAYENANENLNATEVKLIKDALWSNSMIVVLPPLTGGLSYRFSLSVVNFLGQVSDVQYASTKVMPYCQYIAEIQGSPVLHSYDVTHTSTFYSSVSPNGCTLDGDIEYLWKLSDAERGVLLELSTAPFFQIAGHLLVPIVQYRVELVIRISNYTVWSSVSIFPVDGSICAIISGGNRNVPLSSVITLDGSSSSHTSTNPIELSWSWSCYSSGSECDKTPCEDTNGNVLRFPSNAKIQVGGLKAGTYKFTLEVSDGMQTAENAVLISVSGAKTRKHAAINGPCYYSITEPFVLEGFCDDGGEDDEIGGYVWEEKKGMVTDKNNKIFKQPAYNLSPFPYYPNSVYLQCNNVSSATFKILTPRKPALGNFFVHPSSGVACIDKFIFVSEGFVGVTANESLIYQYGYIDNNGFEIFLNPGDTNPRFSTYLPASSTLDVFVNIYDSKGHAAKEWFSVTVTLPVSIHYMAKLDEVKQNLLLSDFVGANNLLYCIVDAGRFSITAATEIIELMDISLSVSCIPELFPQQIHTLSIIVQAPEPSVCFPVFELLNRYKDCALSGNSATQRYLLSTLSLLIDSKIYKIAGIGASIRDLVANLSHHRTSDAVCGEQFETLESTNILTGNSISFTTQLATQTTSIDFHTTNTSFILPPSVFQSDLIPKCLIADYFTFSRDLRGEGALITGTKSLSYRSLDDKSISFHDLKEAVTIEFALNPEELVLYEQFCCSYFSEKKNKWETNGVKISRVEATRVICETNHLTDFAVLLGADRDTSANLWSSSDLTLWVLSASCIVGACCLSLLVVILFTLFPDFRLLVLEGKRPGHGARVRARQVARMKKRTLDGLATNL